MTIAIFPQPNGMSHPCNIAGWVSGITKMVHTRDQEFLAESVRAHWSYQLEQRADILPEAHTRR